MMRLLFVIAMFVSIGGCATVPNTPPRVAERGSADLAGDWQFLYRDGWSPEAAALASDEGWESVSLPHNWNRLGEYRVGRTDATDNRQGTGWYRRQLDGKVLDPAKRHFVEFDGVGNVADVWLNGQHIVRHAGAFTRFRAELTPRLDFSGPNTLLVRADNSDPQPGSSTQDVIPLLGDFFIHGGIYRPARLISVPRSHIALDDFGGPGVYITPRPNGSAKAVVDVLVRLTTAVDGQLLTATVVDAAGKKIASASLRLAASQRDARFSVPLATPRLWSGRKNPYLYSLIVSLGGQGLETDQVTQTFGVRDARFDADAGFLLNGEKLQLRGVSRHQDILGKGWALSPSDHERDMVIIAEMGANSVRVAHYPQATEWVDLADRYGMVVWAEVPFVNKVAFGNALASDKLRENARVQMTEMIRQYFNHPSIVTWGIGNEVDIDLAFNRLGPKADARPLVRELRALSHAEDPSRPTVIADCCEGTPGKKADYLPVLTGEADLMGYNRYYGWYYGKVEELGPHLDRLHATHPKIPMSVSEYGAGGALTQHSNDPEGRPFNLGRQQPEEYQSWWHEQSWPQIRERSYLWGSWIWNMFDFASRVRQEGDATDINTKGLVSYDRAVRKDAFYYYKAQWSTEPVVHITSSRYVLRSSPVTRIKVYSNAPIVELTLNGAPIGQIACPDRICIREGVTLAEGLNRIEASAAFGGKTVVDRVEWTLQMP